LSYHPFLAEAAWLARTQPEVDFGKWDNGCVSNLDRITDKGTDFKAGYELVKIRHGLLERIW
jgi:hypothetical protein